MTTTHQDALEDMIDHLGLAKVLDLLSNIAYEKSEHIRANWQDDDTAKVWAKAGNRIYKAQMEVEELKIA